MRRIINSAYISLDGVIQDPENWLGNGIEPDGTGLRARPFNDRDAGSGLMPLCASWSVPGPRTGDRAVGT